MSIPVAKSQTTPAGNIFHPSQPGEHGFELTAIGSFKVMFEPGLI
jgi:hypothetical protein